MLENQYFKPILILKIRDILSKIHQPSEIKLTFAKIFSAVARGK